MCVEQSVPCSRAGPTQAAAEGGGQARSAPGSGARALSSRQGPRVLKWWQGQWPWQVCMRACVNYTRRLCLRQRRCLCMCELMAIEHVPASPPVSSSTSMHPRLQMSQGKDQPSPRMISGALRAAPAVAAANVGGSGRQPGRLGCFSQSAAAAEQGTLAGHTLAQKKTCKRCPLLPVVPRADHAAVVVRVEDCAAKVNHPDVAARGQPLARPAARAGGQAGRLRRVAVLQNKRQRRRRRSSSPCPTPPWAALLCPALLLTCCWAPC